MLTFVVTNVSIIVFLVPLAFFVSLMFLLFIMFLMLIGQSALPCNRQHIATKYC